MVLRIAMAAALVCIMFVSGACCVVAAKRASDPMSLQKTSFGVGLGLDYGGIGLKIESPAAAEMVTGSLGLGLTGSNVGVKLYPLKGSSGLRPYLAARWGIMATEMYETWGGSTEVELHTGFGAGVGFRAGIFEMEVGYHPKPGSYTEGLEPIGSSGGVYQYVDHPDWFPFYLSCGINL